MWMLSLLDHDLAIYRACFIARLFNRTFIAALSAYSLSTLYTVTVHFTTQMNLEITIQISLDITVQTSLAISVQISPRLTVQISLEIIVQILLETTMGLCSEYCGRCTFYFYVYFFLKSVLVRGLRSRRGPEASRRFRLMPSRQEARIQFQYTKTNEIS